MGIYLSSPLACHCKCPVMACTRCHAGYVGGKNKSEKVFWEFDAIIMQNLSNILQ